MWIKKKGKYFLKYNESLDFLNSVGTFYTVIFTMRSKQLTKHVEE